MRSRTFVDYCSKKKSKNLCTCLGPLLVIGFPALRFLLCTRGGLDNWTANVGQNGADIHRSTSSDGSLIYQRSLFEQHRST
ncbi:unnamed protein product [Jaminaea pallidilutea]